MEVWNIQTRVKLNHVNARAYPRASSLRDEHATAPFCYDFLIKAFLVLKGPKGLPLRNIPVIHALLCLNMVDVGLLNPPPRVLNPVNYALFHFQLPPFDAGRITRATRFLFIPIAFPAFVNHILMFPHPRLKACN